MDTERWEQLEKLYHSALERKPEERGAYLADACREDEELRRELESLLEQNVSGSGLLDHPARELARMLGNRMKMRDPAIETEEFPTTSSLGREAEDGDV